MGSEVEQWSSRSIICIFLYLFISPHPSFSIDRHILMEYWSTSHLRIMRSLLRSGGMRDQRRVHLPRFREPRTKKTLHAFIDFWFSSPFRTLPAHHSILLEDPEDFHLWIRDSPLSGLGRHAELSDLLCSCGSTLRTSVNDTVRKYMNCSPIRKNTHLSHNSLVTVVNLLYCGSEKVEDFFDIIIMLVLRYAQK